MVRTWVPVSAAPLTALPILTQASCRSLFLTITVGDTAAGHPFGCSLIIHRWDAEGGVPYTTRRYTFNYAQGVKSRAFVRGSSIQF